MKPSHASMTVALLVAAHGSVAGPRTAWLIYPGVADSPAIEISSEEPSTWRLKSRQGQVLAEMKQPALPIGYIVNLGQCRVGDTLRDDVLAFVRHRPAAQWSTEVLSLWIADPVKRAFRVAETAGVSCLNETFGV